MQTVTTENESVKTSKVATPVTPPEDFIVGALKLNLYFRSLNGGFHWQFRLGRETGLIIADYWPSAFKLQVHKEEAVQPVIVGGLLDQLAVALIRRGFDNEIEKIPFPAELDASGTDTAERNIDHQKMWLAVLAIASGNPTLNTDKVIARAEELVRSYEAWEESR